MATTNANGYDQVPPHLRGLLRHFADLRDGTHGAGATSRNDKERLFAAAVELLDGYARQALDELNDALLLGRGTVTATGQTGDGDGGVTARWTLHWPAQEERRLPPVTLEAFFGRNFLHPHLRGGTVGVWPLNVFDEADSAAELPILRAIAAADLHNLVFQADYRIVPATVRGAP